MKENIIEIMDKRNELLAKWYTDGLWVWEKWKLDSLQRKIIKYLFKKTAL